MSFRLVSLNSHLDINLVGILTIVGRHQGCDVRIDSSRVSRHHCCLALHHDEIIIRDLASTNGTWVNGERVKGAASLRHGDELGIGYLRYRLEITRDANEDKIAISI